MYELYICDICGSPLVRVQEWYNPNSGEFVCQGTEAAYCRHCEDHRDLTTIAVPCAAAAYSRAIDWADAYHKVST